MFSCKYVYIITYIYLLIKQAVMKVYTHDYTLPSEVERKLYEACSKCKNSEVRKLIEEARGLIQKYLSQDNFVEDDDVDGFVMLSEIKCIIDGTK